MSEIDKVTTVKTEAANSMQIGGSHYRTRVIQPWDYIAANKLGYFEGNIIKYITRWREKSGVDDLLKARHYIDKLIEVEKKQAAAESAISSIALHGMGDDD
jgi:hypothetical protein